MRAWLWSYKGNFVWRVYKCLECGRRDSRLVDGHSSRDLLGFGIKGPQSINHWGQYAGRLLIIQSVLIDFFLGAIMLNDRMA